MNQTTEILRTITGKYRSTGNPCTTEPCLPGMVYVVTDNETDYFITVNRRWYSGNWGWHEYTPQPNDLVMATGYIHEKTDVYGNTFLTIEVVSLQSATNSAEEKSI